MTRTLEIQILTPAIGAVIGGIDLANDQDGETIGVLNHKNDGYAGKRFSDSRKVTLEPAGSSVAQSK
jgi:hypothetical protein